jgi:hypothetical protein
MDWKALFGVKSNQTAPRTAPETPQTIPKTQKLGENPPIDIPETPSPTPGVHEMSSTTNPVLTAAAPSLIAILQAAQTLIANLGTDPAQIAAKFPGAVQVFLGTVEMQVPALVQGEIGALQTDVNAKIAGWITSIQKATAG